MGVMVFMTVFISFGVCFSFMGPVRVVMGMDDAPLNHGTGKK